MAVSDNAATFLGIHNENEFYSAHYLAEVFKGDISDILAQWQSRADGEEQAGEGSYQTPPQRLRALARDYFAMRERSQKERNKSKATEMQREFFRQLMAALDIPWLPENVIVGPNLELPVLSRLPARTLDRPAQLWVLGALDVEKEGADPLSLKLAKEQFIGEGPQADALKNTPWYELINDQVFKQDEPPRWVLLLSDRQCVLIDRYKWLQNRMLRFDWDEILGRKDDLTLKASAALLHADCLVPEQGSSLLDSLDENSHKHAFGVSEDLKYALREAIELLGNEAASQLIQRKDISFTGKSALDADALSRECLRYMYRLLFLFYIEARPELGYVPVGSEAWRKGYSLESLRDLELVKLTSEESRNGYYLHHSINKLFTLIHEGYSGGEEQQSGLADQWEERGIHNSFTIAALDSHLFDPKRTPYLNKVKFTNATLQTIIRLMSLTRETSGRGRKRRGRVSYAQLGINQLGAVYEALLSYRGFFATEDLYEVKKAGDNYNELETGYFVPRSEIDNYKEDEKVFTTDEEGHKALLVHPKGKFIYRLAGRDRQKSASYYTPEVLTKCLVKYTLKERLEGLSADEILNLTVCEPAMGSAAFLNEAVNQLSEAYLTRKQLELNERIPHEDYREALQQVKMHIADHNVYGVDLNPIAVELAEVSLWLNALSQSSQVPWFGYQLFSGNSLIGARRQVYRPDQLTTRSKDERWFKCEPKRLSPETLTSGEGRKPEEIYHFLLPDEGMVGVNDKEAKKLRPDAFAHIKQWKTQFLKPFTKDEIELLQNISAAVDMLWKEHTELLRHDRDRTEDRFSIWGQKNTEQQHTSTDQKDQIRATGIFNHNAKVASHYRRLKLVMDYWCALWFWPLDKVQLLPDRATWLFELNLILQGQVYNFEPQQTDLLEVAEKSPSQYSPGSGNPQGFQKPINDLFAADEPQLNLTEQERAAQEVKTASGELHLEKLFKQFPRLGLVNELSQQFRFFHWELTFADIFADRGGFDVMLGNPPWLKVEWNEGDVLGDYNPQFVLRNLSATKLRNEREEAFERSQKLEQAWFKELEESEGAQRFLNADQNYPELIGQKANLYKCFLPQAWKWSNCNGFVGYIHPEGVYDDPNGGKLRGEIYKRLCFHFQFRNEEGLFPIGNTRKFSINVTGPSKEFIRFENISNLFLPKAIDRCFEDQVSDNVMGVRDKDNKWNNVGHPDRKFSVDSEALEVFSALYEAGEVPGNQARLPAVHAIQQLKAIKKLSAVEGSLSDMSGDYFSTQHWNEKNAQDEGIIKRKTIFYDDINEVVLSGSHIYCANPMYNTAKRVCTNPKEFDSIDLERAPAGYLPRGNYVIACSKEDYLNRTPSLPWGGKVTDVFRVAYRAMLDSGTERTLNCAIIPPGVSHINGIRSYSFKSNFATAFISGLHSSVIYDFLIKSTGKQNLHQILDGMPLVEPNEEDALHILIAKKSLELNAVSVYYKAMTEEFSDKFGSLTPELNPLKRRKILVENDVLVSLLFRLDLDDLCTIFRNEFWVLVQNERETWYDVDGQIIFTPSKGLVGVGLPRKVSRNDDPVTIEYPDGRQEQKPLGWEDIAPQLIETEDGSIEQRQQLPDGTKIHRTVIDDTLPGGPRQKTITYVAPFYLPNREEDYRVAWEVFSERFKENA